MTTLAQMQKGLITPTGQRFLLKTTVPRLKGPAVILECTHCGYAYATSPRVAPLKKCPNCQGGEK